MISQQASMVHTFMNHQAATTNRFEHEIDNGLATGLVKKYYISNVKSSDKQSNVLVASHHSFHHDLF